MKISEALNHKESVEAQVRVLALFHQEIKRLRNAILKHKQDVWGETPVDNDADVELYDVLK